MTWNYAFTPFLWPSLITVVFLLTLAFYSWLRRSTPGAIPLLISCLFGAAWAAGSAIEYSAADLATKILWVKFQSFWQLPLITAVTCFVLEYTWPGRWLTRRNLALLSIPPLLLGGMILTDNLHHMAWHNFLFDRSVLPQVGPAGWIAWVYAIGGLGILNLVVFGWLFLHSPPHRWPVALMLVGQVGGRLLYLLERANLLHSVLPIDLLGMSFEFLMYAFALFGFRIFDPIPMANQTAIDQLQYGMLVLDPQGKILRLNPAASTILRSPVRRLLGRPIQELHPSWVDALRESHLAATGPIELSLGTGPDRRDYEVDVSPLKDWRGMGVGHLLMLRDVTDQKKAQAQILEQQRALATLHERVRLSHELHDELAQGLVLINLQAQMICGLLNAGQVEQAREQLQDLAKAARDTQLDVRGEIFVLGQGMAPEEGFFLALQRFTETFQQNSGVPTGLFLPGDGSRISISPTAEVQLMRIVQEAFANIRKHSGATHVKVVLTKELECLHLTIEDDGAGFDPGNLPASRQNFGLEIMSERAGEVGGHVEVKSAPGKGTQVSVTIPAIEQALNNNSPLPTLLPREEG